MCKAEARRGRALHMIRLFSSICVTGLVRSVSRDARSFCYCIPSFIAVYDEDLPHVYHVDSPWTTRDSTQPRVRKWFSSCAITSTPLWISMKSVRIFNFSLRTYDRSDLSVHWHSPTTACGVLSWNVLHSNLSLGQQPLASSGEADRCSSTLFTIQY